MYCGKITPWEHYPKNLRFHEIQEPEKVLAEFFSSGLPKDHRKDLKEWRHYVTSEEHYKGGRHGPGTLLFNYDMNLRFIEVIHLLFCTHQDNSWQYKNVLESQITEERAKWIYFPKNLSDLELGNPYLVIKSCFKKLKPQHYRDHLHEWLHSALYNNAIEETMTAGEIILVYENVLKLYSAGWLIHQRATNKPYLKRISQENGSTTDVTKFKVKPLQTISPELNAAEELGLNEVYNLILKKIPCVKLINCLGTRQNPFTFYLVILIDDNEKTPEHAIANKIEDQCKFLASVYAFVHKISSAKNGITDNRRFWNTVMNHGIIVHQDKELDMPVPKEIDDNIWLERAKNDWARWGIQGKIFMKGANFYAAEKDDILSLFMLHQAAESSLMALIKVILGYRPSAHNLMKMLKITILFTQELYNLFELETEQGAKLFTALQSGYSEARYKNDFNINHSLIPILKEKVQVLLDVCDAIYKQFTSEKQHSPKPESKVIDTSLDQQFEAG